MSFTTDDNENSVPFILVKGGKADGEIIYMQYEDEEKGSKKPSVIKKETIKQIECDAPSTFYQIPNDKTRCLLIAGPSGSGKSTYVKNYASMYKKLNPDAKIYLFSRVNDDPSLDGLEVTRVYLSEDLVSCPLEVEEVAGDGNGAMCIFDDCDALSSKKLTDAIYAFQIQLLEVGRHMNVQVLITSHLIIGAKSQAQARTILNEHCSLTVFPGSGSAAQISFALGKYYGMTKKQINKIINMKSRWVTLIKIYPQFVISSHECIFVSEL